MNKKITLAVIIFSGVFAIATGGITEGIIYALNIVLISLYCSYALTKENNDSLIPIK